MVGAALKVNLTSFLLPSSPEVIISTIKNYAWVHAVSPAFHSTAALAEPYLHVSPQQLCGIWSSVF